MINPMLLLTEEAQNRYGHPVLQKKIKSNQNPQHESLCEKIQFFIFCLCITLFSILCFSFAVITINNTPEVNVNDVTLTQFMLSPTKNTLYYNVAVNMTFRNPSRFAGINFDKIDVDLMYQGQRLGTKEMPHVFYVPSNEEKGIVNVVLRGEHVLKLINGDEKLVYASENKSGVYKIGMRARIVMRSRVMGVNTETYRYKIMCDNLEVPLTSGHVSSAAI